MKEQIKRIQRHLGMTADGIIGTQTLAAINKALGLESSPVWPTQASVRTGNSIFGKAGQEQNLTSVSVPYPLYFEGKVVRTIRVHRLIATQVQQALREVLAHYGQNEITRLGLDIYGGSYAFRSTRTGTTQSLHSWGIALDFAPQANALNTKAPRASLSHPDCKKWWEIWESHGAVSLGRQRDYDWMHLQFARL